jgi:uncharacterized protein YebE (UPF0316 family)
MENPVLINYVLIPLFICFARITDVTLGTLRIIVVSKGMKYLASVLGFFEVLIWLFAIGLIMKNLTHYYNYVAYATGFGIGNFIGIQLEERLALGNVLLRIITRKNVAAFLDYLKSAGYGFTKVNAEGAFGPVSVIFTIIKRKELKATIDNVKKFNPNAVYSVEDVKYVSIPASPIQYLNKRRILKTFKPFRKGK